MSPPQTMITCSNKNKIHRAQRRQQLFTSVSFDEQLTIHANQQITCGKLNNKRKNMFGYELCQLNNEKK